MKRIVIGVAVAILLLVCLDFAAASAAEYQVSTQVRHRLALPDDPKVTITGFPFLTQALSGDYRQVDVSADKLTVGQLHDVGVRVTLYHVRMPLTEVFSGAPSVRVDNAKGSVLITKNDLMKQLPGVTKLSIQPVDFGMLDAALASSGDAAPGSSLTGITPDQAVRLVATTTLGGKKVEVSTIAALQLAGDRIQISPRDIRIGSGAQAAALPQVVQSRLRDAFTLRIDPGTLPFQVTPTTLQAVNDGLLVSGVAHDVVLNPGGANQPAVN